MDDWTNYINNLKKTKPELAKDIDEAEELASIVGAMIEQRQHLELSQRELAKLCGIPQSSIARIESGITSPNISTLLKIFKKLGLVFSVSPEFTPDRG